MTPSLSPPFDLGCPMKFLDPRDIPRSRVGHEAERRRLDEREGKRCSGEELPYAEEMLDTDRPQEGFEMVIGACSSVSGHGVRWRGYPAPARKSRQQSAAGMQALHRSAES
jgi:hypothetical protein